ncbi:MAG TPA: PIN domain-containing protein [Candidatus Saccharimonadia bacterium]|nr:PIN domain-containing protein [Candidatus Saccharimonadia bacterium]
MYLDANVLLEILLSRANEKSARKLLEEQNDQIFISALTAHLVTHFGKSIVELPILRGFLADYTLLSLEANDFEWAFTNIRGSDFEDAIQLAVAIRNGCEEFATFDKHLAELYSDLIQIKVRLLV